MLKRLLLCTFVIAFAALLTLIAPSAHAQGGDICFRATFSGVNDTADDIDFQFSVVFLPLTSAFPTTGPVFTQNVFLNAGETRDFTIEGSVLDPGVPGRYFGEVNSVAAGYVNFVYWPCGAEPPNLFCLTVDVTFTNQATNRLQPTAFILAIRTNGLGLTTWLPVAQYYLTPVPAGGTQRLTTTGSLTIAGLDPAEPVQIVIADSAMFSTGQYTATLHSATLTPCNSTGASGGSQAPRLNREDPAAPVAVFVVDDALHFYAINPTTAEGYLAFTATFDEMRAASEEAITSGQHVLIREQFNVALYALSSGECQVNGFYSDGNLYEFIFPCP